MVGRGSIFNIDIGYGGQESREARGKGSRCASEIPHDEVLEPAKGVVDRALFFV